MFRTDLSRSSYVDICHIVKYEEYVYKPVGINRLVMSNRLVVTSTKILRLISSQDMHVNAIIKKTSSDRTFVIKTIKFLKKNGIVIEAKNLNHKEMKMIQLTTLGKEITWFLKSTEKYTSCFGNLILKINENFGYDIHTFPNRRAELKSKSWTESELGNYDYCRNRLQKFALQSVFIYINALLARYSKLIAKQRHNPVAMDLLTNIFSTSLIAHFTTNVPQFLSIINPSNDNNKNDVLDRLLTRLNRPVIENIIHYSKLSKISNRFIEREVEEVVNSVRYVIDPSTDRELLHSLVKTIRYEPLD